MDNRLIVRLLRLLPDEPYLSLKFRMNFGRWPNWKNPQTFSEKLQWLKLYDRRPEYTRMVDKYAVKEYVAGLIGEEYVIPTLSVWDKPEEIEWEKLPNQFVLKTTHGGGSEGVVICRDKAIFDREKAIDQLNKSLQTDLYKVWREWPYKNVPKRIIAEKYLEPSTVTNDLADYKYFCFNGEPKYVQVISGRGKKMCIDFFDQEWGHQPFHEPKDYPFAKEEPTKPIQFELMWSLSRKLASNKAFSRIDFYEVGNKVYFGEITFFPTSGMGGFNPPEWDSIFGDLIQLPKK
jgi:hypothetical protein